MGRAPTRRSMQPQRLPSRRRSRAMQPDRRPSRPSRSGRRPNPRPKALPTRSRASLRRVVPSSARSTSPTPSPRARSSGPSQLAPLFQHTHPPRRWCSPLDATRPVASSTTAATPTPSTGTQTGTGRSVRTATRARTAMKAGSAPTASAPRLALSPRGVPIRPRTATPRTTPPPAARDGRCSPVGPSARTTSWARRAVATAACASGTTRRAWATSVEAAGATARRARGTAESAQARTRPETSLPGSLTQGRARLRMPTWRPSRTARRSKAWCRSRPARCRPIRPPTLSAGSS